MAAGNGFYNSLALIWHKIIVFSLYSILPSKFETKSFQTQHMNLERVHISWTCFSFFREIISVLCFGFHAFSIWLTFPFYEVWAHTSLHAKLLAAKQVRTTQESSMQVSCRPCSLARPAGKMMMRVEMLLSHEEKQCKERHLWKPFHHFRSMNALDTRETLPVLFSL